MGRRNFDTRTPDLESLRNRLDDWRRKRTSGRIPERFWQSAANLARTHGVGRVCQSLRLDFYGLKRRLRSNADNANAPAAPPDFMEIDLAAMQQTSACTVRLEDGAGKRLVVEMANPSVSDLVQVARSLWDSRP